MGNAPSPLDLGSPAELKKSKFQLKSFLKNNCFGSILDLGSAPEVKNQNFN